MTWPGLTVPRVEAHLQESPYTVLGHLHKIKQGIRSTKPPIVNTMEDSKKEIKTKKVHQISLSIVDTKNMKHTVAMDLPGRYPITSARGHKYIFILYDYDSNYIHGLPIKLQRSCHLVEAFQTCYQILTDNGFAEKIVRLDNEISDTMVKHIQQEQLEYQLASPGDHRVNYAERAIQMYKNHFLSTLHGTDPDFPNTVGTY